MEVVVGRREVSDTSTQIAGSTETKIVKMSDNPPLVSAKLLILPRTSFPLSLG